MPDAPFPSPTKIWHDTSYPAISPSRRELSAAGKTVLITGGGTGIGAETARSFARAGAKQIAILGRRQQPLLETKAALLKEFADLDVVAIPTDVSKKADVDAAFAKFAAHAGGLSVLVHAAAVAGPLEGISELDELDGDAFMESVNINIAGALWMAQAFARHAVPSGVAIDVSSLAAFVNMAPKFRAYMTSKWAVYRLWDCLAYEKPEFSIFHFQPGVVDTDMNKKAGGVKAVGFEDHVSLPADFSVWLSSSEARFLRNKFLCANWDVDELKARAKELEDTPELTLSQVGWPFGRSDWQPKWGP